MNSRGSYSVHINNMELGSDASVAYSISYGGMGYNIIGNGPDKTIYVDTTGGAVGKWDFSASRPNSSSADPAPSKTNSQFCDMLLSEMSKNSLSTSPTPFTINNANTKTGGSFSEKGYIYQFSMDYNLTNPGVADVSVSIYKGKPNGQFAVGE